MTTPNGLSYYTATFISSLIFHLILPSTTRHLPLHQLLLQPCNLLQTLRIPNHLFDLPPLLLRQLNSVRLLPRSTTTASVGSRCRRRDIGSSGFDAGDLGGEGCWGGEGSEKLRGSLALGVFYFLVVEEADGGTAPDYVVAVVLQAIVSDSFILHPGLFARVVGKNRSHLFPGNRVLQQCQVC